MGAAGRHLRRPNGRHGSRDQQLVVFALSDRFIASASTDVLNVLIVTHFFAAVLAFHNAASRYFYALRPRRLPAGRYGENHPRHR